MKRNIFKIIIAIVFIIAGIVSFNTGVHAKSTPDGAGIFNKRIICWSSSTTLTLYYYTNCGPCKTYSGLATGGSRKCRP